MRIATASAAAIALLALTPQRSAAQDTIAQGLAAIEAAAAEEARWLEASEEARYGRRLLQETYAILGPEAPDPALRFAGNNLACASCHAVAGTRRDALPLSAAYAAYPAYVARSGRIETIEDRVDDCMRRSMNGRPLPEGGAEMRAIVAYLRFLGEEAPAFEQGGPPEPLPALDRPADPQRGAELFGTLCAACHGADGAGQRVGAPGDALGYRHPPLWGADSFNDGAGMARMATFATFIHEAMPPTDIPAGPRLLPGDAWDIAAFVLSHGRPAFSADAEKDRPGAP